MRFPLLDQVALPVIFERYLPGALHPDGRRYLPQLIFRLHNDVRIGVVDRHHYVDPELTGRGGRAQLVYLLSEIALQSAGAQRQGIRAERPTAGYVSMAPPADGVIVALPNWELRRGALPYDTLFTELLLDVGDGIVGVRTSMTAPDMAAKLGKSRFEPSDWIHVARSRIDILGFEPTL